MNIITVLQLFMQFYRHASRIIDGLLSVFTFKLSIHNSVFGKQMYGVSNCNEMHRKSQGQIRGAYKSLK